MPEHVNNEIFIKIRAVARNASGACPVSSRNSRRREIRTERAERHGVVEDFANLPA